MTVYAVMVFERHSDPDVELFAQRQDAIARARAVVQEYAHPDYLDDVVDEELTDNSADWLYYGTWSGEGDRVFVVEREIQGAT